MRTALPLLLMLAWCGMSGEPVRPVVAAEGKTRVDADSVVDFVLACQKENGAFGPPDHSYTDAAWNYPAVCILQRLGEPVPRPEAVMQHGLGQPAGHVGYGHWLFFHQHQLRHLLKQPLATRQKTVRLQHQGFEVRYYGSPFAVEGEAIFQAAGGSQPHPADADAAELGYYNLSSLYYLLAGLQASHRTAANPAELIAFIQQRQAPGGGFVDLRTADGKLEEEEAHVAHTFQAIAALELLGGTVPDPAGCVKFLQSCQTTDGGFRWNPQADLPGNRADVYYAWAAARALRLLDAEPTDAAGCIAWINRLQNADGGFGDQPGWRSRLYSTWYAVDALAAVAGDPRPAITAKTVDVKEPTALPAGLTIYQGVCKAPLLAAEDLPGLASRGFSWLALKSEDFALASSLRAVGLKQEPAVEVVLCPEAYPHRAQRWGGASLHHIGNFTLDPDATAAERAVWDKAHEHGQANLSWREYGRQVIGPMRRAGSLVYPEQDFEMEHAYQAYDAGLASDEGYNAMLVGFNWTPRDFVRVFPWRERYVDKLTPIADVDAHGDLAKWSPQLDHTRQLYLASGPGDAAFQEAARQGRVVCVVAGIEGEPNVIYGPPAAVAFVKSRLAQWQGWEADPAGAAPINDR
ncbi:prenyltransferase/squalene oxidase repeat-containing protein [Lignipirellula cremea]|uniref:Geranylgeranyl transferase type II subunit beta n=1 Tax=Lignipirellula cremea TaxID=2528010 RepID=A0A518DMF1_9BACT|nr:prenyltransferase/squalene oxidase repeat-containing protein [Lignipirellula cremea]QDU93015.1 Prenyltransferase and squalene oxidase repeat protein [Lignipirellula cremea]